MVESMAAHLLVINRIPRPVSGVAVRWCGMLICCRLVRLARGGRSGGPRRRSATVGPPGEPDNVTLVSAVRSSSGSASRARGNGSAPHTYPAKLRILRTEIEETSSRLLCKLLAHEGTGVLAHIPRQVKNTPYRNRRNVKSTFMQASRARGNGSARTHTPPS